MDENEQLFEQVEILQSNQAKLENLLEATCLFARQHITALQAGHNAKKKDKQKRSSTDKAEWLTSEANRKRQMELKAERAKREAEEKLVKE